MPRILRLLLISAVVAAIATGGVLVWALQADSSDFAFVPRAAVPTIGVVTVAEQEPPPKGAGSLYYSTVGVRHATIFETWFGVGGGGLGLPFNHGFPVLSFFFVELFFPLRLRFLTVLTNVATFVAARAVAAFDVIVELSLRF